MDCCRAALGLSCIKQEILTAAETNIHTVYDLQEEYDVPAMRVCTLCHPDTELAVETVGALVGRGAGVGCGKLLDVDGFALQSVK